MLSQAKTLTACEVSRLLAEIQHNRYPVRDRLMLLMTYYAGLRVGEVASLTIGDVANSDGGIKSEIRLKRRQTKGGKTRTVMISTRLATEIEAYLAVHHGPLDRPLFVSQKTNDRFTVVGMANLFKSIYKIAGLDNASSHSGRRTFITTLAGSGISVRVIQELAGHSDMSTTQRYIDVNDIDKSSAVNSIRY